MPSDRSDLINAVVTSPAGNQYQLLRQVGSGSFGHVFRGLDKTRDEPCAIKVEPSNLPIKPLKLEARAYRKLQGCEGIPSLRDYIETEDDNILVMDLLGPSLGDLFDYLLQQLSLKSIAQIALKMVTILETMHDRGYIHRDIKPGNILFDVSSQSELFVIDFGASATHFLTFSEEVLIVGGAYFVLPTVLKLGSGPPSEGGEEDQMWE